MGTREEIIDYYNYVADYWRGQKGKLAKMNAVSFKKIADNLNESLPE